MDGNRSGKNPTYMFKNYGMILWAHLNTRDEDVA
jgi:hypothetical protein